MGVWVAVKVAMHSDFIIKRRVFKDEKLLATV